MTEAVVIDEWALVRQGVLKLLSRAGIAKVRLTATATDGLGTLDSSSPDLLVIGSCADATMLDVVRRARDLDPTLKVIALVAPMHQRDLVELCSAGANAIVMRSSTEDEFLAAVDHVQRGERYLAPDLLTTLFSDRRHFPPARSRRIELTTRERAVLTQLVAGRTNREIATTLCIGSETVKTHLGNIYAKLAVSRRDQAISLALQGGLV
jgi:DNA-binding NarL/FixJ family response regulator